MRFTSAMFCRPRPQAFCLVAISVALVGRAHADDITDPPSDNRVMAAAAAGLALALVPAALGGVLFSGRNVDLRRAGIDVMAAGLMAGPVVAHGLVGEMDRGLATASVAGAFGVSLVTLLAINPDALATSTPPARVLFGVLLTGAVGASVVGVMDTLGVRERAHAHSLALLPLWSRNGGGVHGVEGVNGAIGITDITDITGITIGGTL